MPGGAEPMKRVALMLVSLEMADKLGQRFRGLGQKVTAFYPGLKYDLMNAQVPIAAEHYCVGAFFSAAIWAMLAAIFIFVVTRVRAMAITETLLFTFGSFYLVCMVFLLLHLYYPKILARNVADKIDRGLIFAMRDMLIQTSSGIPLFTVIANIADGDYGIISSEFKRLTASVRSGTSLTDSLEELALRNQSKYLKKTCWQLITAMRSGSNLTVALKGIIKLLVDYQMALNKAYNSELNFIVLIYLLVSAVLPTVGTTVLVIFSLFKIIPINETVYQIIVYGAFFLQAMIIGYIYIRRPNMYM
jgi:pilus assembly protein TadC